MITVNVPTILEQKLFGTPITTYGFGMAKAQNGHRTGVLNKYFGM